MNRRLESLEICEQIEQWKKKLECSHEKVLNDLKATCASQHEKLKRAMTAEYECDCKLKELRNANACMIKQIQALECQNSTLQCKLAESVQIIKNLQEELCCARSQLAEKDREIKHLTATLKCKEEELCEMCRQLDICRKNCERLNEMNEKLEQDYKCMKAKLHECKVCAALAEENFARERESLCNELKTKCELLRERDCQLDKAVCELKDEKCKVQQLLKTLDKLVCESERNHDELSCQLQRENCTNKDLSCKFDKLQKANECNVVTCTLMNSTAAPCGNSQSKSAMCGASCCSKFEPECGTPIAACTVGLNARRSMIIAEKKYAPSLTVPNYVTGETELLYLNCEFENLKKEAGIYF